MFSVAYDFVKDLMTASESKRISVLSADQLELTLAELKRKMELQIHEIAVEEQKKQGEIKTDFINRNLLKSSMYENFSREAKLNHERRADDVRGEFEYAKKMILLEKEKLIKGSNVD